MLRLLRIFTQILLTSSLLTSCVDKNGQVVTDPCDGVDCSGHGKCKKDNNDQAFCECDQGYHAQGLNCLEDVVDPCEGVGCSGHGTCVTSNDDQAKCECDQGYHAEGLECIEDDPCQGIDCSGHGTCIPDAEGDPSCKCDEGYQAEGLECVLESVCSPGVLREDALNNGEIILAGVHLPESTPIADILADPVGFEGKLVQVEGLVTYVCMRSGNMFMIADPEGNQLKLAGDWYYFYRDTVSAGRYVVSEGIFQLQFCRRGMHLAIGKHGTVVGTINCPID
jgi:EGF domain-containing protein